MVSHTKSKKKKRQKILEKRGLATAVQPEPDFSRTNGFGEVLGINVDCSNAKFHKYC